MINEELKQLVKDEAEKLREFATAEELSRLDAARLYSAIPSLCIYGQMTGDCFNSRAQELLEMCAIPYSRNSYKYWPARSPDFSGRQWLGSGYAVYSPIEFYISQPGAKKAALIGYLRNERDLEIGDL